ALARWLQRGDLGHGRRGSRRSVAARLGGLGPRSFFARTAPRFASRSEVVSMRRPSLAASLGRSGPRSGPHTIVSAWLRQALGPMLVLVFGAGAAGCLASPDDVSATEQDIVGGTLDSGDGSVFMM